MASVDLARDVYWRRRVRDDSFVARRSQAQNATRANAAIRDQIERRFAWQARISTAIVGLTGFYMLYRSDMWDRFRHAAYWWIDAMVAVWLIFTLMLFIVEPFNLHRRLLGRPEPEPQIALKRVEWLHRILLIISLITVLGAVMGSHGPLFE